MRIEDWGRADYRPARDRQIEIRDSIIADSRSEDWGRGETIALVEHNPVYTLGLHGKESNLTATAAMLESRGAECIRIERGGDITYHGPGQIVVYPMLNIMRRGIGVKRYVEMLEESVIELLGEYGIESSSNDDAIGVWLDWEGEKARKICAIGVKVSHGVTMHGFALNVNTDLTAFTLINPCGFTDKGVTSISLELGKPVDMTDVKQRLTRILTAKFARE